MKLKFWFALIFIYCLVTFISCEKNSDSEPSLITDCFQFKDSQTDIPIEGVFVRIHYLKYGVLLNYVNYTDAAGMFCWEHKNEETLNVWFASIDHYEDIGCHINSLPLPNIVSMKKASYYKFIIKNIEPQQVNDVIEIDYRSLECNGDLIITLSGSDIDTTIIKETRSGNYFVNWESRGANINNASFQTITQSRDTATVEIDY